MIDYDDPTIPHADKVATIRSWSNGEPVDGGDLARELRYWANLVAGPEPVPCERCDDPDRCCQKHRKHVSPHRGCTLR